MTLFFPALFISCATCRRSFDWGFCLPSETATACGDAICERQLRGEPRGRNRNAENTQTPTAQANTQALSDNQMPELRTEALRKCPDKYEDGAGDEEVSKEASIVYGTREESKKD